MLKNVCQEVGHYVGATEVLPWQQYKWMLCSTNISCYVLGQYDCNHSNKVVAETMNILVSLFVPKINCLVIVHAFVC